MDLFVEADQKGAVISSSGRLVTCDQSMIPTCGAIDFCQARLTGEIAHVDYDEQ